MAFGRIRYSLKRLFSRREERAMTEVGQAAWESLEADPRPEVQSTWTGAVLLNDEIEYYCRHKQYPLIQPFDQNNLKPARYQLT